MAQPFSGARSLRPSERGEAPRLERKLPVPDQDESPAGGPISGGHGEAGMDAVRTRDEISIIVGSREARSMRSVGPRVKR
jgi:hypothetical protein